MTADFRKIVFPATTHPNTRALYGYWLAKCGARPMPARRDIDPTDILRGLLPGVSLVDVVSDERRYVYRPVGTEDVEVRGKDPTGKSVKEGFFGPSLDNVLGSYDRVVSSRAPFLDPTHFKAPSGRYVTEENDVSSVVRRRSQRQ
jgi:hypothetical protein